VMGTFGSCRFREVVMLRLGCGHRIRRFAVLFYITVVFSMEYYCRFEAPILDVFVNVISCVIVAYAVAFRRFLMLVFFKKIKFTQVEISLGGIFKIASRREKKTSVFGHPA